MTAYKWWKRFFRETNEIKTSLSVKSLKSTKCSRNHSKSGISDKKNKNFNLNQNVKKIKNIKYILKNNYNVNKKKQNMNSTINLK